MSKPAALLTHINLKNESTSNDSSVKHFKGLLQRSYLLYAAQILCWDPGLLGSIPFSSAIQLCFSSSSALSHCSPMHGILKVLMKKRKPSIISNHIALSQVASTIGCIHL